MNFADSVTVGWTNIAKVWHIAKNSAWPFLIEMRWNATCKARCRRVYTKNLCYKLGEEDKDLGTWVDDGFTLPECEVALKRANAASKKLKAESV